MARATRTSSRNNLKYAASRTGLQRFRVFVPVMAAILTFGCSHTSTKPAATAKARQEQSIAAELPATQDSDSWVGVYSSPSEIGRFSGTVLSLEHGIGIDWLRYRMTFYTDAIEADEIHEKEKSGWPEVDGRTLYVPVATGHVHDGETSLSGSITRYTRMRIRGRTVLLREDALREFRLHNRLYDYGILIKVMDAADFFLDLDTVKHESIKVLYDNTTAPWQDPFVHGPNAR